MEEPIISEYSNIYVKILEIGESKLSVGLSYHELINELKTCIEFNGCSVIAIKKFFCDNFFHKELHDGKSTVTIAEFDTHHNCNFIMSGEAWNKLQQYKHFQNSKTQINLLQGQLNTLEKQINQNETNSNNAKKESSKAFWIAILSILISSVSVLFDYFSIKDKTQENIKDELSLQSKQQKELLEQQNTNSLKIYYLLDSLTKQQKVLNNK